MRSTAGVELLPQARADGGTLATGEHAFRFEQVAVPADRAGRRTRALRYGQRLYEFTCLLIGHLTQFYGRRQGNGSCSF